MYNKTMPNSLLDLLIKDKDQNSLFQGFTTSLFISILAMHLALSIDNSDTHGRSIGWLLFQIICAINLVCWIITIRKIVRLRRNGAQIGKTIGLAIIAGILLSVVATLYMKTR